MAMIAMDPKQPTKFSRQVCTVMKLTLDNKHIEGAQHLHTEKCEEPNFVSLSSASGYRCEFTSKLQVPVQCQISRLQERAPVEHANKSSISLQRECRTCAVEGRSSSTKD